MYELGTLFITRPLERFVRRHLRRLTKVILWRGGYTDSQPCALPPGSFGRGTYPKRIDSTKVLPYRSFETLKNVLGDCGVGGGSNATVQQNLRSVSRAGSQLDGIGI